MVAVEGLDGAGKATLVAALEHAARTRGQRVAGLAFPRYRDDVHAEIAGEALHGHMGDLAGSVHGMALMFALDRRDAAVGLREAVAANDLVLVDRYVASNAAYGAARLDEPADGGFVGWVAALEVERFAVPVPDAHVLVRLSPEHAARRVRDRSASSARTRDAYEADAALQARCATVYDALAAAGWLAPWSVIDPAEAAEPSNPSDPTLVRMADALLDEWHGAGSAPGSSVRSDTIET
jgi:dTMP kinase